MAWIVVLYQNM